MCSEISLVAKRAAWRVVQIDKKISKILKHACEENPKFATVAYSTIVRYVRKIRDNDDLAAMAEEEKHDRRSLRALK